MDWGNMKILKIHKADNGSVKEVDAELALDNKDYKKTLKVTWLADSPSKAPFTPVKCYHFDHIISKAILDKDEDFKKYADHQTEFVFDVIGDNEMRNLRKGDIIQISRRGYYIVDQAFVSNNKTESGVLGGEALVLFNIPEGNKRESPTSYMSLSNQKYPSAQFAEQAEANGKPNASKENQPPKSAPTTAAAAPSAASSPAAEALSLKIKDSGDRVRNLKTAKAPKEEVDQEVANLLSLKKQFKELTGADWVPEGGSTARAPAVIINSFLHFIYKIHLKSYNKFLFYP